MQKLITKSTFRLPCMAKSELSVKCFAHKICLANPATTIQCKEFGFLRVIKTSKFSLLFCSAYHHLSPLSFALSKHDILYHISDIKHKLMQLLPRSDILSQSKQEIKHLFASNPPPIPQRERRFWISNLHLFPFSEIGAKLSRIALAYRLHMSGTDEKPSGRS